MKKFIRQTSINVLDPLLGYAYSSEKYLPLKSNEKYVNGIVTIGEEKDCNLKIAILGGSTSDIWYNGSWVRPLYEKLNKEKDIKPYIISAAISGYSTNQEVFKLIRDLLPYSPNIIISLSGVNDLGFIQSSSKNPYIHNYQKRINSFILNKYGKKDNFFNEKFKPKKETLSAMNGDLSLENLILGTENDLKASEHWLKNIRIQKAICQEFEIKYNAFLQPIYGYGEYSPTKEEEEIHLDFLKAMGDNYQLYLNRFYDAAKLLIKDISYIDDLTDIFKNKSNMYMDPRHPNEKGNNLIAQKIIYILKQNSLIN